MSRPLTCTQCGAPLHGGACEYCGTSFEEPSIGELITLHSDDLAIQIQNARHLKQLDALYDSAMAAILTPNELRQNLSCYGVSMNEATTALNELRQNLSCYGVSMNEATTALCDLNATIRQYGETDEIMMSVSIEPIKPKFNIWQRMKSLFKRKGKQK